MTDIELRRVYDDPSGTAGDGVRVFVDKLWPRGESKEKFHYDIWAKEIAPSTELREWFHANPAGRWEEFRRKYIAELNSNPATDRLVKELQNAQNVTLLYSSHDSEHNNAVILADYLKRKL
ncbi:MAG: DUF488 family protein [Muribaculum sp.]|nr:DUF488 family protein [Muribaculum sp.]